MTRTDEAVGVLAPQLMAELTRLRKSDREKDAEITLLRKTRDAGRAQSSEIDALRRRLEDSERQRDAKVDPLRRQLDGEKQRASTELTSLRRQLNAALARATEIDVLRRQLEAEQQRSAAELKRRQVAESALAARDVQKNEERIQDIRKNEASTRVALAARASADAARRETEDIRKILASVRSRATSDIEVWKQKITVAVSERDAARKAMSVEQSAHGRTKELLRQRSETVATLTGEKAALRHQVAVTTYDVAPEELERQIAVLKMKIVELEARQ